MRPDQPQAIALTIIDRNGEMHVFLDPRGDDHIVTKYLTNNKGQSFETMLPCDGWAWDRAVARAKRAAAFL